MSFKAVVAASLALASYTAAAPATHPYDKFGLFTKRDVQCVQDSSCTKDQVQTCLDFLNGKGTEDCVVLGKDTPATFCHVDTCSIMGQALKDGQQSSSCSDVAKGAQAIVDKCGDNPTGSNEVNGNGDMQVQITGGSAVGGALPGAPATPKVLRAQDSDSDAEGSDGTSAKGDDSDSGAEDDADDDATDEKGSGGDSTKAADAKSSSKDDSDKTDSTSAKGSSDDSDTKDSGEDADTKDAGDDEDGEDSGTDAEDDASDDAGDDNADSKDAGDDADEGDDSSDSADDTEEDSDTKGSGDDSTSSSKSS